MSDLISAAFSSDEVDAQWRRFCALLGEEPHGLKPAQLDIQHFERWKPDLSRRARQMALESAELADLIIALGETTRKLDCRALSWWTRGNILYHLDLQLQALEALDIASSIYRQIHNEVEIGRLGGTKTGVLQRLGRYPEGIACGLSAIAILRETDRLEDRKRIAILKQNLALCYTDVGQYVEALDHLDASLYFWRTEGGDSVQAAFLLNSIGFVKGLLGQYVEADEALREARPILVANDELNDVARVDLNLVWLAMLRKAQDQEIEAGFAQARASRQCADPQAISTDLICLDLFQIGWLIGQGHAAEAWTLQHELQTRCLASGIATESALSEILRARLLALRGDVDEARQVFEQVAQSTAANANDRVAFQAHYYLARSYVQTFQLELADNVLDNLINRIDVHRGHISVDDFKAGYLEDKLAAYHLLTSIRLQIDDVNGAHAVVERAKARTLVDVLGMRQNQDSDRPPQVSAAVSFSHDSKYSDREALDDHRRKMRQRRYSTYFEGASATLDSIAGKLQDNELVISYAVSDDGIWAFLLDAGGLVGKPISLGQGSNVDDLNQGLNRVLKSSWPSQSIVRPENMLAQQLKSAQKVLATWYAQYVDPLTQQVDFDRYQRLIISPDQLLNHLPFGCLFNAARQTYLVETHEIVLMPSLTAWSMIPPRPISNQSISSALSIGHSWDGRLHHTLAEAALIKGLIPQTTLLLEADATHEAVMGSIEKSHFVFFAAHGQYRADAPELSYIQLADGRLHAIDITYLTLAGANIVLSACESAKGLLMGNEMLGLVRAFLSTGAQGVVAASWRVEDTATQTLMTHFMAHLDRPRLAHALRQAQIALIGLQSSDDLVLRRMAHPFFWGAWSVFGRD